MEEACQETETETVNRKAVDWTLTYAETEKSEKKVVMPKEQHWENSEIGILSWCAETARIAFFRNFVSL